MAILNGVAHMAALREAVGPQVEIIFEVHTRLSPTRAIEPALRDYERARLRRTGWIVRRSRAYGRMAQLEGKWSCRIRNAVLRATPDRAGLRFSEKLWRFPER